MRSSEHARGDRAPGGAQRGQAARGGHARRAARDGRQPALLRRRRALPGGPRRGRVHGGLHLLRAPRGGRGDRADHPVELPADDGDLEDRPRARGRQHDRAEARRDHPRSPPCAWRSWRRRSCRKGVLNVVTGRGAPDRPGADLPPRGRHGLADGLGGDRQAHRAHRRRLAQARAPRARRQGAGARVRRRRHGGCPGDDRRHRLLQRRPGLHRRHARAGRGAASTTMSSPASSRRPRAS